MDDGRDFMETWMPVRVDVYCEEDIARPNRIDCIASIGPGQILLVPVPSPLIP